MTVVETAYRTPTCEVTDRLASLLKDPRKDREGVSLVDYFIERPNVEIVPVIDAEQCTPERLADVLDYVFTFHGERIAMGREIRWCEPVCHDIEWQIVLHKFYYAVGLGQTYADAHDLRYALTWKRLVQSWIDHVPLSFLTSDVMGRRVQNWLFSLAAVWRGLAQRRQDRVEVLDEVFFARLLVSLHDQVTYLCAHLTPARNHRTIELYAIFLAAVMFPEFHAAADWLAFSLREMERNIVSDFRPDGVHVEQSTDYHHLVLKNYLGVKEVAVRHAIELPSAIDATIQRGLEFSCYAHKPDGQCPSFSDGDVRSFLGLLAQGDRLYQRPEWRFVATQGDSGAVPCVRSRAFPDGGYYIFRSGWGRHDEFAAERYLMIDAGPLGDGNHGHLDVLSFEMAAYGRSLIVDPGRYTYDEAGDTNWRVHFRQTAAHNTVVVDGKNVIRYEPKRSRHKVTGSEPQITIDAWCVDAAVEYFQATVRSHEYDAIHQRRILFVAGEYFVIVDRLRSPVNHRYELLFHLADACWGNVNVHRWPGIVSVDAPGLRIVQSAENASTVAIDDGWVSRTYGVKHRAPIVRYEAVGADVDWVTVLYPYQDAPPRIGVTVEPSLVIGSVDDVDAAIVVSVEIESAEEHRVDTLCGRHEHAAGNVVWGEWHTSAALAWVRRDLRTGQIVRQQSVEPGAVGYEARCRGGMIR